MSRAVATIRRHVMWNRLVSIVEEQAQTLIRTAFSTSVREAGDLAAGVFDRQGRMLAQAVTGTPGHINAMAGAVVHFLDRHPLDTMAPGDAFITNDPWLTSGHLHDITVVTPTFYRGEAVGLFANTCHVVDIGGRGFGPDGRQVFEEGLAIPILPLLRRGEPNETLLEMVRSNVREPRQVIGDIFAFAAANETGSERLVAMLAEFATNDLDDLAEFIIDSSRRATLERVRELTPGTYRNEVTLDGYHQPITLRAALTVHHDGVHVDYAGTSPASGLGINVVLNYTKAYTCFGVKCAVAPDVPNNHGSLEPITFAAPPDSILNAQRPHAVAARHMVGHLLPDTVLGCLHQVLPGGVQAEGAASLWILQLRGGSALAAGSGYRGEVPEFELLHFNSGGSGARPDKDGLSATAFPSGVRGVPVEASEAITPVIFWRKEFRPDSGGAGRQRGGLGQVIELGGANGVPFDVLAMFERVENPARGRDGGHHGAPGVVALASGATLRSKGQQTIPPDDRLRLELPGGAGFGDPFERLAERVADDVRNGLVSPESAREHYGVVLRDDGSVDEDASAALRAR